MRRGIFQLLLIMVVVLLETGLARGDTNTHWLPSSGKWRDSFNWSNGVPRGRYVFIGDDGIYGGSDRIATIESDGRLAHELSVQYDSRLEMTGGSLYTDDQIRVGYYSTGTFTQTGGTNTSTKVFIIGLGSDGHGIYELNGDLRANNEWIGRGSGTGEMSHTAGPHTVDWQLVLGFDAGSEGTYELGGTGSLSVLNNPSDFSVGSSGEYVGLGGTGTFIQSDGTHSVETFLHIGYYSGSSGTYELSGGSLTAPTINVGVAGTGQFNWTGGTLDADTINVNPEGSMTIGQAWTCDGELNISGGLVSIVGTLDIDGDGFINMSTGGMLALYGDADDSLMDFLGLIDGTDAIRYWDDSISDWADITDATYCRDYTLNYLTEGDLAGYTLLTVERAMDGDANGDGAVDVSDLGILATYYDTGDGYEWGDGDFTGDGYVDVSDLGIQATAYGNTAAGTSSQAVPEPATLGMLLALGGMTLLWKRRRLLCN